MGLAKKLGVMGVGISLVLQTLTSAFALEGDSGTTPVPGVAQNSVGNSGIGAQIPASINTGAFAGLGSQLNACFTMFDSNFSSKVMDIAKLATGEGDPYAVNQNGMGPNSGLVSDCGTGDLKLPDPSSLSCDLFLSKGKNALFSRTKLANMKNDIEKALKAVECKQKKLQALNEQLTCVETQSGALKAQIQSMENIFDGNFQNWEKDMLTINTALQDRKDQDEFVKARLNGSKDSGRKGLLQIKDELQAAIGELNGAGGGTNSDGSPSQGGAGGGIIFTMQEQAKEIRRQRDQFDLHKAQRAVSLMNECFSKKDSSLRCAKNGPVMSPKEYILCRYEQNLLIGKGPAHELNREVSDREIAGSRRGQLESLLNSVSPVSGSFTGPQQTGNQSQEAGNMIAAANSVTTIRSFDDLKSLLDGRLGDFQDSGLDIKGEVLRQYQRCYSSGASVAKSEVANKTGLLGSELTALDQFERRANAQGAAAIDKYAKSYDSALTALTGNHSALDPAVCNAAGIDRKVGCLQELGQKLNDIYRGRQDGQGTAMSINIPAQDSKLAFNMSCNGVLGCVNTYQNVEDGLKREVTRIGNFKKAYALQAKTSLEKFVSTMARQLSPQAAQIRAKLQQVGAAARSLGVDIGVVGDIKSESIQSSKEGELPKKPEDIMAVIGGKMTPHFPDVENENFSSAKGKIAGLLPDLNDKLASAHKSLAKLDDMESNCRGDDAEKIADALDSAVDSCTSSVQNCLNFLQVPNEGSFGDLLKDMSQINSSSSASKLQKSAQQIADSEKGPGIADGGALDPDAALQRGIQNCQARVKIESDATLSAANSIKTLGEKRSSGSKSCTSAVSQFDKISKRFKDGPDSSGGSSGAGSAR